MNAPISDEKDVPTAGLKTEEGWRASKLNLTQYLQVGDSVDESIADYVLCELPPACYTSELLQMGEPNDHVKGKPTYITLHRTADQPWKYVGTCHLGSFTPAK